MLPNFHRMFTIIDEVFATRNDPHQLQVDDAVIQKLVAIHPATLGELANSDGPLIWVLLIPTHKLVMEKFLAGEINERQILEQTYPGELYDCIYLCSVTTLREVRGKGETKKLCLNQINSIRSDHPIEALFVWSFSDEGELLADSLGRSCGVPVFKRG